MKKIFIFLFLFLIFINFSYALNIRDNLLQTSNYNYTLNKLRYYTNNMMFVYGEENSSFHTNSYFYTIALQQVSIGGSNGYTFNNSNGMTVFTNSNKDIFTILFDLGDSYDLSNSLIKVQCSAGAVDGNLIVTLYDNLGNCIAYLGSDRYVPPFQNCNNKGLFAGNFGLNCLGSMHYTNISLPNILTLNSTYSNISSEDLRNVRYMGLGQTGNNGGYYYYSIENYSIENISDISNTLPELSLQDCNYIFCLNESGTNFNCKLNGTDSQNDDIYFFSYWNKDYEERKLIDDFENVNNLYSDGWYYYDESCNYNFTYQNEFLGKSLLLFKNCSHAEFKKNLDNYIRNDSYTLEFITYPMLNDSTTYGIKNNVNESILELKIETVTDGYLNQYFIFSYLNRTEYVTFGDSYYLGYLSVKFQLRPNNATICINGLDENSFNDCTDSVNIGLNGITNNNTLSFYLRPTFYFPWESYQTSYVLLDELYYSNNNNIDWILYDGTNTIQNTFWDYGEYTLHLFYTDEHNLNTEYKKHNYHFDVSTQCPAVDYKNTTVDIAPITDQSRHYLDAIPDGQSKFQDMFFIFMFIAFIVLMIFFRNLSISLICDGLIFTFIGVFMTINPFCWFTPFVIFALGVGLLVASGI